MARKHRNSGRSHAAVSDAASAQQTIERFIAKGNVKEAFKQAKLLFNQQGTPENRRLVERTYVLRIQSLIRGGMPSAAHEVAGSMLEFGVKDPQLIEELVVLLPQVGLADKVAALLQGQVQSPEAQARLQIKLADRAVLNPEEKTTLAAEVREAAGMVRQAFAAVDAGEDEQALQLLQGISRSSPLADWRYFVRGLIAYWKSDLEQAHANWERLSPDRAAAKIAGALRALSTGDFTGRLSYSLRKLETIAFGEPLLDRVVGLQRALDEGDWSRALQQIGPLRSALHRIDPQLSQRLTLIMQPLLMAEMAKRSNSDANRLQQGFQNALEPLPSDPLWTRFQALAWEGPDGDPEIAVNYWERYASELGLGIAVWSANARPGEVRQLQALIWRRIGETWANLAYDPAFDLFSPRMSREEREEADELGAEAIDAYKTSLQYDPAQRATYDRLLELAIKSEQPQLIISTLQDMLKVFPDDAVALRRLVVTYQKNNQPEEVLSHLERLRGLTPLDASLGAVEAWARCFIAREHALKKVWDTGRAELDRVESSLLEHIPLMWLLPRRAAFEFKAGETERAEAYVAQAYATHPVRAVTSLLLAVESVRYKLSKPLQKRFNADFKAALVPKASGEIAGGLAAVIREYIESGVDYTGRAAHLQDIIRYIRRTTRAKYQESELRQVCQLLQTQEYEQKLLETFSVRGLRNYPKSPFFLKWDIQATLHSGPFSFDPQALQKKADKLLALAEASQHPEDIEALPEIKSIVASARDLVEMRKSTPFRAGFPFPSGFPFGPDSMPNSTADFRNLFESMFGGQQGADPDFDDSDSDPDFGQSARPRPPKRKPR